MLKALKKLAAAVSASLVVPLLVLAPVTHAATTTTLVKPTDLAADAAAVAANPSKWLFYNDENDTINNALGSFVTGPATAPLGSGSAQISVTGTQRRNLATYQFSGTPLSSITELKYSTYNPSAGNPGSSQRSGYLQFNVDFNGSDTWQRRLTFVPANNGTVTQNSWKEWDALNGGNALWTYSGATWPVTGESGFTPKTWNKILTDYPGVRVRVTDAQLSIRVGEPYADGYTENIDKVVFGTAAETKVFNFDPVVTLTNSSQCKNGGWANANTPSYKSEVDCVANLAIKQPILNLVQTIVKTVTSILKGLFGWLF